MSRIYKLRSSIIGREITFKEMIDSIIDAREPAPTHIAIEYDIINDLGTVTYIRDKQLYRVYFMSVNHNMLDSSKLIVYRVE